MSKENNSREVFEMNLKGFKETQTSNMDYAWKCAQAALIHFHAHGDVIWIQEFHDAMDKNYSRRVAFIAWLRKYCPIAMEGGKFKKDKGDNAVEFNMADALSAPFWEQEPPEVQITNFSSDDLNKAIWNTIKKFQNNERYHATDKATENRLSELAKQFQPQAKAA